jgi:hypothetical protein
MSRPSDAALSCRVLERPRRRESEVTAMDAASNSAVPNSVTPNITGSNISGSNDAVADGDAWGESPGQADYADAEYADHEYAGHEYADRAGHEHADHEYADHEYADQGYPGRRYRGDHAAGRPRPYRPGRGGYDAEAAAAAARARYVVRQRLVLALVLLAVATGLLAGGMHLTGGWYLHAGVDVCLVGYLVYLRRQVRVEQTIRARRAARMAGSRYRADADRGSPLLDDPLGDAPEAGYDYGTDYEPGHGPPMRHAAGPMVRRGRRSRVRRRPTVGEAVAARETARRRADAEVTAAEGQAADPGDEYQDYDDGEYDEYDEYENEADDDSGEQGDDEREQQSALPRLRPSALPERPRGTVVLELDDEDPELHDLDSRPERGYRRAAGQ